MLILPKLTTLMQGKSFVLQDWPHLIGLSLADPKINQTAQIDVVLGANIYGSLLTGGVIHGPTGSPSALLTTFGWILMCPTDLIDGDQTTHDIVMCHSVRLEDLSAQVAAQWKQDIIKSSIILTPEEEQCESLFINTHY